MTETIIPFSVNSNAIYDAVGVNITSLPVTAEKVYEGLKALGKNQDAMAEKVTEKQER